jgi:hypothetical protein
MKNTFLNIIFAIFLVLTIVLTVIYYQNKSKVDNSINRNYPLIQDEIYPVGEIEDRTYGQYKEIGGYIEEKTPEKIVIKIGKDSDQFITIMIDENETVYLKANFLDDIPGYAIENVLSEGELENYLVEGAYIQSLVNEILREGEEATFHAKTILFFPE